MTEFFGCDSEYETLEVEDWLAGIQQEFAEEVKRKSEFYGFDFESSCSMNTQSRFIWEKSPSDSACRLSIESQLSTRSSDPFSKD